VIDCGRRRPSRTGMAGFAHIRGIDMQCTLAGGNRTIVATGTGTINFVMIYRAHWRPGGTRMTGFTYLTGIDVAGIFAGGDNAVMTGDTGISNRAVINTRTFPSGRDMANITSGRRHHM